VAAALQVLADNWFLVALLCWFLYSYTEMILSNMCRGCGHCDHCEHTDCEHEHEEDDDDSYEDGWCADVTDHAVCEGGCTQDHREDPEHVCGWHSCGDCGSAYYCDCWERDVDDTLAEGSDSTPPPQVAVTPTPKTPEPTNPFGATSIYSYDPDKDR
jgi:hypothetical protein